MNEELPPQVPESSTSDKDSFVKTAAKKAAGVVALSGLIAGGTVLAYKAVETFDHDAQSQAQEDARLQQQADLNKFQNGGAQEEYDKQNQINYYNPPAQTEATNPANVPGSTETTPITVEQLPVNPTTGEHELPAPETH